MAESWTKLKETRVRLEKSWEIDLDWSLYPASLKEVCESASATNTHTI